MAISKCFETTKDRLEFIFKNRMIDPGASKSYFLNMHPVLEMNMQRPDVVSGCIKFLIDVLKATVVDTKNYYITIKDNICNIYSKKNDFPIIVITNFRSQYIVTEYSTKTTDINIAHIYNNAMRALSEALSIYYAEVYFGKRKI